MLPKNVGLESNYWRTALFDLIQLKVYKTRLTCSILIVINVHRHMIRTTSA